MSSLRLRAPQIEGCWELRQGIWAAEFVGTLGKALVQTHDAAAFGFVGVDRTAGEITAAGVGNVVDETVDGPLVKAIVEVDGQWRVHADTGMEAAGWLPGAVTHPRPL